MALEQEVVAHGQQHVDVGLEDEPAEQLGEARLHLGRVQREQLLELVHDQQRVVVPVPPAGDDRDRDVRVVDARAALHRLGVARQLAGQRLASDGDGALPGVQRTIRQPAARRASARRAGTSSCPRPRDR